MIVLMEDLNQAFFFFLPFRSLYMNTNIFYLTRSMHVKVKVAQLCLTLCDPKDCIIHGIL